MLWARDASHWIPLGCTRGCTKGRSCRHLRPESATHRRHRVQVSHNGGEINYFTLRATGG